MKRIRFWIAMAMIWLAVSDCLAQPQAPITWGDVRILMSTEDPYYPGDVTGSGDTLAITGGYFDAENSRWQPTASISPDQGTTWGSWHIFGDGMTTGNTNAEIVFTSQGILCCTYVTGYNKGFYRSTDLGDTWTNPLHTGYQLTYVDRVDDYLFCLVDNAEVKYTNDCGQTFSPGRPSPFPAGHGVWDLAASVQAVHCVSTGQSGEGYPPRLMRYAQAPLLEGTFSPSCSLNAGFFWTNVAKITFGDDHVGMILSGSQNDASMRQFVLRNVSHDEGLTWSEADTVTPFQSAQVSTRQNVVNWGHYWLCYWYDTTHAPGFDITGTWCQFSANSGRGWYPPQQVEGIGWSGLLSNADLSRDRARIWVVASVWEGHPWGNYSIEWAGEIRRDTLLPVITPLSLPPDTVEIGNPQLFLASITDNDTLFQEHLVVRTVSDTTTIPMEWTGTDYMAYWTVSHEGRFFYRIEGEDFWENLGSYPGSGWAMLVTPDWIDAVDDAGEGITTSYDVEIFPNPSNGWPAITLAPSWSLGGEVTLRLFNVLGECVWRTALHNATGELRPSIEAASGLYLLEVRQQTRCAIRKVLILR